MKGAGTLKDLAAMLEGYLQVKGDIDDEVLEDDEQMFSLAAAVLCDKLQAITEIDQKDVQTLMKLFRTKQLNSSLYELLKDKVLERLPNEVLPPWPPSETYVVWIGGEPTKESTASDLKEAKKRMDVWMAKSWCFAV